LCFCHDSRSMHQHKPHFWFLTKLKNLLGL
jgi:hypothetical protein